MLLLEMNYSSTLYRLWGGGNQYKMGWGINCLKIMGRRNATDYYVYNNDVRLASYELPHLDWLKKELLVNYQHLEIYS